MPDAGIVRVRPRGCPARQALSVAGLSVRHSPVRFAAFTIVTELSANYVS